MQFPQKACSQGNTLGFTTRPKHMEHFSSSGTASGCSIGGETIVVTDVLTLKNRLSISLSLSLYDRTRVLSSPSVEIRLAVKARVAIVSLSIFYLHRSFKYTIV